MSFGKGAADVCSAIFCTFELLLFGPTLTLKNKNCLKNTQLDHLGHCQP